MLVKKNSGIQDLADLNGKIVALAAGTTAERYVRAALDRNKINVRVLQVRDNSEGLLAVNSQRVDAFVNDAVLLGGRAPHGIEQGRLRHCRQAAVVRAGRLHGRDATIRGLLAIVNGTIAKLLASGELQKLYDRWITPYGVPIEGEVDTLFKIEAIDE